MIIYCAVCPINRWFAKNYIIQVLLRRAICIFRIKLKLSPYAWHIIVIMNSLIKGQILGRGAFGMVRLCKCPESDKLYAVKKIRSNESQHDELTILDKYCSHEFINTCHKIECIDNSIYIHLEFECGGNLYDLLHGHFLGNIIEPHVKFYTYEILLGLEYLHDNGIIYRDLKLENVLISKRGHIRLCDFSVSCCSSGSRMTVCGSPQSLAPEQLLRLPYSNKVDLWCVGVVIYEMLHGRPPFINSTQPDNLDSTIQCNYNMTGYLYTEECDDILHRLLCSQPCRLDAKQALLHKWFSDVDTGAIIGGTHKNVPYLPSSVPFVEAKTDVDTALTFNTKVGLVRSFL